MSAEDRPLTLSIEAVESVNMGDHGERLRTSHVAVEGETVDDLVRRVFRKLGQPYMQHDVTDELVIRVVVEADGTTSGEAPRTTDPWSLS